MADSIKTKTARAKLTPRREPYFEQVEKGVYIGFRKLEEGAGTWIGRYRLSDGKQTFNSFGHFAQYGDDEYKEAKKAVDAWAKSLEGGATPGASRTVKEVCEFYIKTQAAKKPTINRNRSQIAAGARDAERRFERLVYAHPIGALKIDKLRKEHLTEWKDWQISATMKGSTDPDAERRAQDSYNRNLAVLKAALNLAVKEKLPGASSSAHWQEVKKEKGVAKERKFEGLGVSEYQEIMGALEPDLRAFGLVLLMTGARPGELASCDLVHYSAKLAKLTLPQSKTKVRTIDLSPPAKALCDAAAKDRIGSGPLFVTADGKRWTAPVWGRAFRSARAEADMPDAVLYLARHLFITQALKGGTISTAHIARYTGTSLQMIMDTYLKDDDAMASKLGAINFG